MLYIVSKENSPKRGWRRISGRRRTPTAQLVYRREPLNVEVTPAIKDAFDKIHAKYQFLAHFCQAFVALKVDL